MEAVVGRSCYAAEKTFPIGAQIAQVCFAVKVAPPSSFRESLRDGFLKKQAHYELQSLGRICYEEQFHETRNFSDSWLQLVGTA